MSFPASITLHEDWPAGVTLPLVYDLQGSDLKTSFRGDSSQSVDTPHVLTIGHETTGGGVDRHRVRLDFTKLGLDGVTPKMASVYTVVVVPRGAGFTDVEISAMIRQIAELLVLVPAYQDKLLNNEL